MCVGLGLLDTRFTSACLGFFLSALLLVVFLYDTLLFCACLTPWTHFRSLAPILIMFLAFCWT